MSTYTVYTQTANIPTYILYQCPACGKTVVSFGSFSESSSYSDQGSFTRKELAKRKAKAGKKLVERISERSSILKNTAIPISKYYTRIQCTCPECRHSSLEKWTNSTAALRIIAGVMAFALLVYLMFAVGLNLGTCIFASFFGYGISYGIAKIGEVVCESFLIYRMRLKGAPPFASSDLRILAEKAKEYPAYANVTFLSEASHA